MRKPRRPAGSPAAKHRALQRGIAAKDRAQAESKPLQVGGRRYPEPPFPKQHQPKPGHEDRLDPAPMYDAPFYSGSGKLRDKVAVVTGADSGIGRAVAVLFAREGADIAALYLDETADAEATRKAVEREGRRCLLIAGDVAKRSFCFGAAKRVEREFGRVDVLVNNAAFQLHAADIEDITEEHFDTTLKTNLYGYFHMTQACLPLMAYGSAIVNTGSVTGTSRKQVPARLLDHQRRHSRLYQIPVRTVDPEGDSRQRRGAGPCLDATESGGQRGTGRVPVRSAHSDEASRSARRNRSCLCISRLEPVFELHHR